MKYRKKNYRSAKRSIPRGTRLYAKRRKKREPYGEDIDLGALFEFADTAKVSELPDVRKKTSPLKRLALRLRLLLSAFLLAIKKTAMRVRDALCRFAEKRRQRLLRKSERPSKLSLIAGAVCGSLTAILVCVSVVLLALFGRYIGSYETVTVPDLVGTLYSEEWDDGSEHFSYAVSHEYNPNVPAGHVISQTPAAGVTRRVSASSGKCLIALKVCYARPAYILPSLSGRSERDAALELKNNGISVELVETYSDTAPRKTVISTVPEAGARLSDGDTVTLTVSLGPQFIYCSVPDLLGLSETEALSRVKSLGLTVGDISYAPSALPIGTVISQTLTARASVREGTSLGFTVSAGAHEYKKVPDLYGLTLDEARELLRSYGLIIGTVIPVSGTEANGAIVSQEPQKGTPITSSTVCVDVYISS